MSDDEVPLSTLLNRTKANGGSKRKDASKSSIAVHDYSEEIKPVRSAKRPRKKSIQSVSSESTAESISSKKKKNDVIDADSDKTTEELFCSEDVDNNIKDSNDGDSEGADESLDASDDGSDKSKTKQNGKVQDTTTKEVIDNGKLVCMKCYKRIARSTTCPKQFCQKCCQDPNCQHKKTKKQKQMKEKSILNGTNWVNKVAAEKRRQAIRKGAFREEAFEFMGETLVIWSLKDFFAKDLWKDDAIERVTKKREKGKLEIGDRRKVGDVGKFHKLLERHLNDGKSS